VPDDARRRPIGRGLSQARICAAALAIIDEDGLPALNMRRLGADLGVDAMAVYRHLPNKQAILDGVVDLVLTGLAGDSTGDVRERVHAFFSSLRDVLAEHPNAIPLVASSALQTGAAKQQADGLLAAMRRSEMSEDDALDAFHTLESFTLGFAWLEVAGFVGELPENTPFLRRNVRRNAAQDPASAGTAAAPSNDGTQPDRFERCLRGLLEALLPR
jgi:AcrR family transcriptional regulator